MKILAIDPGSEQSAYCIFWSDSQTIGRFGKVDNAALLSRLPKTKADVLVVEMIASYGMPVGREVFETCVWIGRFLQAWPRESRRIFRADIKMHLCKTMKAKDGNIRAALIDRFGPQGTKKAPGATYGISKDSWAALAVAVAWSDLHAPKPQRMAHDES